MLNATAPPHTYTVVCLEDDYDLARLIEITLRFASTVVYVAHDGIHGLQLIRQHHPDLILLDLGLPGLNGLEVYAAIQNDPDLRDIPVFILTAIPSENYHDTHQALIDQAKAYIVKPFSVHALRDMLQSFLQHSA